MKNNYIKINGPHSCEENALSSLHITVFEHKEKITVEFSIEELNKDPQLECGEMITNSKEDIKKIIEFLQNVYERMD